MPSVRLQDEREIDVPMGKRLVLGLEDGGVDILHRCGGNANCTTCRVAFHAGEPTQMTEAEYIRLEARGLLGQVRLSCQILCDTDMTLEVLQTLSNSDLDDAGMRPADTITPIPVWRVKPA